MRIMLIGSGGAGKSTLARQLGERLNLPVHHLDCYFWRPGWVETPAEEWDVFHKQLVYEPDWIIDGNYGRTMDERLDCADIVIFIDLPTWITMGSVLKRRVMYSGKTRPDMREGCPEKIDWEFIKWVWTFRKVRAPKLRQKLAQLGESKTVFTIRSRREIPMIVEKISALRG